MKKPIDSATLCDWRDRIEDAADEIAAADAESASSILERLSEEIFERYLDALHEETRKECANG